MIKSQQEVTRATSIEAPVTPDSNQARGKQVDRNGLTSLQNSNTLAPSASRHFVSRFKSRSQEWTKATACAIDEIKDSKLIFSLARGILDV